VSVPIPPEVAAEVLAAMELNESKMYAFWNPVTVNLRVPSPMAARFARAVQSSRIAILHDDMMGDR
jgi:hypothetical protein